jgi:hypothetical protein
MAFEGISMQYEIMQAECSGCKERKGNPISLGKNLNLKPVYLEMLH